MAYMKSIWKAKGGRHLEGEMTVPGDKSISQRALLFSALAQGESTIKGLLQGEDVLSLARALRALGVRIEGNLEARVQGVGMKGFSPPASPLDLGNSGTAMRLLCGVLAAAPFSSVLVGDKSLMARPMERVAAPLRQMGACIATTEGHAPISISPAPDGLWGMEHKLSVASAQVKSAILLAGLFAKGMTAVEEPAPSRDHTERLLPAFGVRVEKSANRAQLQGGQELVPTHVQVPGDFSSAFFFLVAGALALSGRVLVRGVGVNPTRTGGLEILRAMGANIAVTPRGQAGQEPMADIDVLPSSLKGIEVDPALVPLAIDEFPAIFIAAALASGRTLIRGAEELRVKESDRIHAMAQALLALGARVRELPDGMEIEGVEKLRGGVVDSQGDHRVAMAMATASLRSQEPITILDTAPVATSFPGFLEAASALGLSISKNGL